MEENKLNIENQKQLDNEKQLDNHKQQKTKRIIYYILGILEVLFAFRLIFKILGANPESLFVSIVYSVTGLFLIPFNGIFSTAVTNGLETESVLEPALIIAMIVYVALAWGIVKLIDIITNKNNETL